MWDKGRTAWSTKGIGLKLQLLFLASSVIHSTFDILNSGLCALMLPSLVDFITAVAILRLKSAIISPHWWITQQPSLKSVLIVKTKKMSGVCGGAQTFTVTLAGNFPATDNCQRPEFTSSFYPRVQMSGCHSNLLILLQMSDGEVPLRQVHQGDHSM